MTVLKSFRQRISSRVEFKRGVQGQVVVYSSEKRTLRVVSRLLFGSASPCRLGPKRADYPASPQVMDMSK